MRKKLIGHEAPAAGDSQGWLELDEIASVEVSSEDAQFPAESVFVDNHSGWRAAGSGEQTLRLVFDHPRAIHRIQLSFSEHEVERTQEFTLRWSGPGGRLTDIVRQQWTFSPEGSTSEVEDYRVNLNDVQVLELKLKPDLQANAVASLARWRVA